MASRRFQSKLGKLEFDDDYSDISTFYSDTYNDSPMSPRLSAVSTVIGDGTFCSNVSMSSEFSVDEQDHEAFADAEDASTFSECHSINDVLSKLLSVTTDPKELDDLFRDRRIWQLWNTSKNEAQKLLEESLCTNKKTEDANHTLGVHQLAYEGALTTDQKWRRNYQHELGSDMVSTSQHMVDSNFREALCDTKHRLDEGQSGRRSQSPLHRRRSAEDSTPWRVSRSPTRSPRYRRSLAEDSTPWRCPTSPRHNKIDDSIFSSCDTIQDALKIYYAGLLDQREAMQNQSLLIDRKIWQLWNTNRIEAQKMLEDSLCRNKKIEDSKHEPGMHPSAFESCLTPKAEWLRSREHEVNGELKLVSRQKIESRFRESLRCDMPKRRFRSSSPFTRIDSGAFPFIRSRSLSQTRPGGRLPIFMERSIWLGSYVEDATETLGMLPLAYESYLTPKTERLDSHERKTNKTHQSPPRRDTSRLRACWHDQNNKPKRCFQEPFRCDTPKGRGRSNSPFTQQDRDAFPAIRSRSLSQTRPGSRVPTFFM